MGKKIFVFCIVLLVLVSTVCTATAESALGNTDSDLIKTYAITKEEINYYTEELNQQILTRELQDFEDRYIVEFDISDDGRLIIGLDDLTILICDSNATVQCAFSFRQCYSDVYYLNWIGDTC